MPYSPYIKYASIALVVVILAALLGWYFFLKREQTTISEEDAKRGAGMETPLGGALGNTYENIVTSFSTVVGGAAQSEEYGPSRLAQVGKSPTAGHGFIETEGKARLRFVERGSGYVFEITPESGALRRITNTLVPRTYNALIAGDYIVMRGIDEHGIVTTTLATLTASTTAQAEPAILMQRRLADSLREIALEQDGDTFVYVVETPAGGKGIRSSWNGKSEKEVFSSAIVGWQIDFREKGQIILTQNAEDGIPGRAYRVGDGSLEPIVDDTPGLTFLPHPSLQTYLYGESDGGGLALFARVSGTSSRASLPVRTIAKKCVWSPREPIAYCGVPQQPPPADFLGGWYRGETHTSDAWWKIDVRANSAEPLYASTNATFDVENPMIDPSGKYIAFRNAADKTLWLLRIEE